ncbi:protein croquemort [Nilaparvata lugens]|uniref:protein croquemort n=1 Tax=Nilaparvata lugens TaxID=108931 RepID=UPI00193DC528|nr:protein croquemort [Nilaparvata lugens]
MDKYSRNNICMKATFAAGVFLLVFGTFLMLGHNALFDFFLKRELALAPGSSSYKVWRETPVPMSIEFYFFNWTNPLNYTTEKPKFVEVGPYSFKERHKKVNITWNSNGTVSFRRVRIWHFDAENSNGFLDDRIQTLNPVALTAASTVRDWSKIFQMSLSMALKQTSQKVHVVKTVNELLFKGYSDRLLDIARQMPKFGGVKVPFDKFGWFYTRNGSAYYDGFYNMDTGDNDISQLGKLRNWNYNNETSFYDYECAGVKGSAGEFWPPHQRRDTPLTMFSADLCRSVSFNYFEDRAVHGIDGYTYSMDEYVVDNGTLRPENECFCNGECSPSGVINVTSCRYGAPAFVSYPHFFLADPYYRDAVDGMSPDAEKHRFYITMEPRTGIPLDVAARLQINLLLQTLEGIGPFHDTPYIYFPMMWFNQRASMTGEMAAGLKFVLQLPTLMATGASVLMGVGLLFIVLWLAILFFTANQDDMYKKNLAVVHLDKKDKNYEMKACQPLINATNSLSINSVQRSPSETT